VAVPTAPAPKASARGAQGARNARGAQGARGNNRGAKDSGAKANGRSTGNAKPAPAPKSKQRR